MFCFNFRIQIIIFCLFIFDVVVVTFFYYWVQVWKLHETRVIGVWLLIISAVATTINFFFLPYVIFITLHVWLLLTLNMVNARFVFFCFTFTSMMTWLNIIICCLLFFLWLLMLLFINPRMGKTREIIFLMIN